MFISLTQKIKNKNIFSWVSCTDWGGELNLTTLAIGGNLTFKCGLLVIAQFIVWMSQIKTLEAFKVPMTKLVKFALCFHCGQSWNIVRMWMRLVLYMCSIWKQRNIVEMWMKIVLYMFPSMFTHPPMNLFQGDSLLGLIKQCVCIPYLPKTIVKNIRTYMQMGYKYKDTHSLKYTYQKKNTHKTI